MALPVLRHARPPSLRYGAPSSCGQKDFSYQRKPGKRVFFHVGAANYRSNLWVNGQKVCEHEGGFTPFDCEITGVLKDGGNFVVMAVDNTRLPEGIPTQQTDWWNYGGLSRDVSLVEVPEQFIDDFDLHLKRGSQSTIEGWVHVEGGEVPATVSIPELNVDETALQKAYQEGAIGNPE